MVKKQGQNIQDTERKKTSAIANFMPQILPDDEIAKDINSLNLKANGSLQCGSYMS